MDNMAVSFTEEVQEVAEEKEMPAKRLVQVEGILRLIHESYEKLEISLMIPRLLEEAHSLRKFLAGTKYEHCGRIVLQYLRNKKLDPAKNNPEENFNLLKLIDMFHENYGMLQFLPPGWLEELSAEDKKLLNGFKQLKSIAQQRLNRSAISELDKEKQIHQIYHDNEQMKKNIIEFQSKLRNQKVNLRWRLAAKDGVIQKYEEELAFKKWDNKVRIREEMMRASVKIHNAHMASTIKQRELEDELEKAKTEYDKLLKSNIAREKEVRDEKNKLLLQLQALLKKFDQNIGDKVRENTYLEDEYEELKKQFEEFMIEYQREEAEYEAIVKVKEEEERQRQEERVLIFMMTRAAKIIQRAWRRYLKATKKVDKKKGKKRK